MKPRTLLYMTATVLTYVCSLSPIVRVRAQMRPAAPAPPVLPSRPAGASLPIQASPASPAEPVVPMPPAVPAMPSFPAAPAAPASPAPPAWENEHTWGAGHWGDGPAADCSDLHVRLHDEKPTMESEERTLSKAEAPVLRIHELPNGGAQIQGWDKNTYSVTACKFAIGPDTRQLLSEIRMSVQGGDVSVAGPGRHDDWTAYLLVRTPRGADVEVTAHNGPVAFYTVDGKITARTTNGPISLKDCSGEGDVSAQNGPISFSGASGKLRIHTQNGPISIALGSGWNGSELVADAVNGPLTLRVPSGFQSSFLVESNGHSPISCHASICSEARKTWDDQHRRIEYGSGSPVIRLSTENGPISVAD
jgi:hypothetical protein